jgi:hypothetical protein
MRVFDLGNPGQIVEVNGPTQGYQILPDDSIILSNTPLIIPGTSWQQTHQQLQLMLDRQITAKYVFIDGSYDPIKFSNREIQEHLKHIQTYFPQSKIAFLSSRVQHWYDNLSNVLYLPYFICLEYQAHKVQPRKGRMGCLNRNNSPHRIWLMHHLLKDGLLDPNRDVYSVSFTNIYNGERTDVTSWLGMCKTPYDLNYELNKWPPTVATHPDNFPNDFSTDHPAWNTGIAIVTETEPGYKTMLTEKVWKAIRSSSCWTAYMGAEGYTFLEDIGFEPRFFKRHASFDDITPITKLCRSIDTEAAALDYYHSNIRQIKHNFEWSGGDNPDSFTNFSTPWHRRFLPEFKRRLNSL